MSDVRCHVKDNVRDDGRDKNIEAFIIFYDTASYKHYGREVGIFDSLTLVAALHCNVATQRTLPLDRPISAATMLRSLVTAFVLFPQDSCQSGSGRTDPTFFSLTVLSVLSVSSVFPYFHGLPKQSSATIVHCCA